MATPTLNLAPDVQTRYQAAISDPSIASNPQAIQQITQQAQQQSAAEGYGTTSSAPPVTPSLTPSSPQPAAAPSYKGLKGVFLNQNSPLNLQSIGGTLGMLGAGAGDILAAPETAGTSLLGLGALSAGGGAAGSALGRTLQNKLTGQAATSGDVGAAVGGGIAGAAGPLVGKLLEGVSGTIGNKLIGEGEDAATRSLGLGQGGRNQFFKATQTRLPDFLASTAPDGSDALPGQKNLSGMGTNAISAAQDNLQQQYNSIARESGIKVPLTTVRTNLVNNLAKIASDITGGGNASFEKALTESENLLAKIPRDANGDVNIADLTEQKGNYLKGSNFDATNPGISKVVNNTMSKGLLQTVNDAADQAGLTGTEGQPLSAIGQKLQNFRDLTDILDNKEPGQTGPTSLQKTISHGIAPVIGTSLGGAIGGVAGGESGAAKGAAIGGLLGTGAAEGIMNSPAILSKLATTLPSLGEKLLPDTAARLATQAGLNPEEAATTTIATGGNNELIKPALGMATRSGIAATAGPTLTSLNGTASPVPSSTLPTSGSSTAQATADTNPLQSGIQAMESGQPLTTQQYTALVEASGGNSKILAYINNAYTASNPTQAQGLNAAASAYDQLSNLYTQAEPDAGSITGAINNAKGKYGPDVVQSYNKAAPGVADEIFNQLYAASGGTDAPTRAQILNLIPTIDEKPEVAQNNLAQLKTLIQNKLNVNTSGSAAGAQQALNSSQ